MNVKTSGYLVLYGLFLILAGLLGFLSNPEKAKSALITGGAFGVVSMVWGVLGAWGQAWTRIAAIATTCLLAVACGWRAVLGWSAVAQGGTDKIFAASVVTAMLAASVLLLPALVKRSDAPRPQRG